MKFYSAMKNEFLSFANKWMELKNIILSEVSQAQKTKNCMFSLICGLRSRANTANVVKLGLQDKEKAQRGGIGIGNKPKHGSI
jgi:hypothetical protein